MIRGLIALIFTADTDAVGGAGLVVLDDNIRVHCQALEILESFGRLKIQNHAPLIAVPNHERGALVSYKGRCDPHIVADIRPFDLDHVRPLIRE